MLSAATPLVPASGLPADDPFLDIHAAAAIPNLHPQTLRQAVRAGRLRGVKVNGGRVLRFRRSWVIQWLEGGDAAAR